MSTDAVHPSSNSYGAHTAAERIAEALDAVGETAYGDALAVVLGLAPPHVAAAWAGRRPPALEGAVRALAARLADRPDSRLSRRERVGVLHAAALVRSPWTPPGGDAPPHVVAPPLHLPDAA